MTNTGQPLRGQRLDCLIIDDTANSGPWNMAVDEALLEAVAAETRGLTLRWYRWTPATVSLGYFQAAADRDEHQVSRVAPWVRRLSGGGAIVHDHELTYSLICPATLEWARDSLRLYRAVHGALVETLVMLGISATMYEPTGDRPDSPEPFLCFQRRAAGDVLVAGHKICGSAQRRRHGAVLQHGSLLLRQSAAAPELPGLAELAPQPFDAEQLALAWRDVLARRLKLRYEPSTLTTDEQCRAEELAAEKFASSAWNDRR